MPTFLIPLNHSIGHALAFNPDDGLLYHWSYPLMEKIDLTTFVVTNIPTSGQTTSDFPMAAAYMGSGKFLLTNINNEIISVTSDGNGTFLAWSIHLKGIIQTIPEYGITASDNCAFTLSQTAGLASGSFFPEGTTTNTFVATDASGNSTPCSFTVTVKNDVKPEVTCPSNITVNIASGICGAPVTFTVYATDNCTFIANLVGLSSGSTFPIGTTTNLFSATDPSNNTATCSFTVTVNEDQNLPDFIIYATEDVKFGEYNYIGGDVGVTGAKGKANFKKYVVLDPFHVTAADIKIDLPSNVTYTTSAQATGGPNPTFYPYNGSTIGLNNIDVNTNTTLNGNYKDVKVKKGVTVTLNGNNFGKMTIEEGATVTFTASIINMEELKVNKGKKNESTTVVNFSQPASVKVADKVSVEDDAHVNVGGPKVTFYVGDNHGGDESFKVNGDNTRVTANIMIPKGKLKVTGGGSPTRPTFMTGWYIIEKLEANGKYTYWDKYDCSTTPSLSSAREKVVSDIRVRAELERNVITFVSNQGDKTDYWTAEKRHETTGTFEKLEIRNNVKSNEALQYLTFYDNAPSEGDNFYRIKLSLAHGDVVYSAVEKVYHQKSDDFIVYPNPSDDEAWINLTSFEGRQVTLVLSDVLGKTVHQQVIEKASAAPYRLDVANMPSGLYLIKVQAQGKRVFIRKLQVAR